MTFLVAPMSALAATLVAERPERVATIASPERPAPALPSGTPHLHLAFHDIAEPAPGLVLPPDDDVLRLLAFGRAWTGARPLLLCCEFGVSRSPAACFALACARHPGIAPDAIAQALREAAPQATPNARIVALADCRLGRGGAMTAALRAIGRGRDYRGPEPFRLDLSSGPGRG